MTAEQAALQRVARTIGQQFGLGITSWALSTPVGGLGGAPASAGTITGTVFQEAKPTFRAAAPGLPLIGVRRWLLVVESGSVAVGQIVAGGGYTFRVAAGDAELINVWEVTKL